MKNKKKRVGVVYSTDQSYDYSYEKREEQDTLPPEEQQLYVSLDKKQRKGKKVTLVESFVGSEEDLRELSKTLKTLCGVGGSVKEGVILIQGDHRDRIVEWFKSNNYSVKRKG